MRRGLTRRVERLEREAGMAGGMPAELAGAVRALLAAGRERAGLGPMSDEERATRAAPDFRAKLAAAARWRERHPGPAVGGRIAAMLERRRAEDRR